MKNLHFLSKLSANSFITWRTVWEFEICAQFWNKWIGFDFYRQLTDRLPTLPTSEKVTPLIKNLHFWSNLSANSFVKSILFFFISKMCLYLVWVKRFGFVLGTYRWTDKRTYRHTAQIIIQISKVTVQRKISIFCSIFLQIALSSPFLDENFKSVLKFGIG